MDRESKTAKATNGARPPVARRSRPRAAADTRTVAERLADALAQQAATSAILRVMSASPTDVQPVMEAVAEQAARLCHAQFARVLLADGGTMRPLAQYPNDAQSPNAMHDVPLQRTSITGRAVLERATIHLADALPLLDTEFPDAWENAHEAGFRAILAVPLLHRGDAYGALFLWRREPGLFTPDQVALVETFATQAAIAIANVRLFQATQEALEQQTATSEILHVISRSQTDVQPVLQTIAAASLVLCQASSAVVATFDGTLVQIGGLASTTPEGADAIRAIFPRPASRDNGITRAVLTCATVMIPDVRDDPEYATTGPAIAAGFRSVLAVPLLHDGIPIGAISLGRTEPGPFPDTQATLLTTFADQAVIAIENVRLFRELADRNHDLSTALDQRTATAEILRVINGSHTDVQPVFDAIVRSAVQLCRAQHSLIFEFDGELLKPVSRYVVSSEFSDYWVQHPMRPGTGSIVGRAALERKTIHAHDVLALSGYEHLDAQRLQKYRTVLAVPLLRGDAVVGVIVTWKTHVEPFTDKQVELVETFAAQAVIAIENARLLNELEARNHALTESLEQQTATSRILGVISQSRTDVQPVFDTIAQAALELCRAASANVFTYDGQLVHLASFVNLNPDYIEMLRTFFPRPPGRDTAVLRAILTRSIVAIPDVLADDDYAIGYDANTGGFRSVLAVPLLRDGNAIGGIAVGRSEAGPFPDTQVALLQTFADQAVIAIGNVRLFNELGARNRELTEALEQQTATSEILRVISRSPTDAQPVFDTIVHSVLALCDATFSGVYLLDGDEFSLASAEGMTPRQLAAFRAGYPRKVGADTVAGRAALVCHVVQTPDLLADPDYCLSPGSSVGARTVLGVPLIRDNQAIGSIGVWRGEVRPFSETQIALLQTFADQAVIAIENVRLFRELEARTTALTRSVDELRALGDVGQAVSSTLDLETVLSTIVSRATELTGMDGGSVWEYDEGREEFYLHTADRLSDALVAALRATPIRKGEGALGGMALTGEPVQISNIVDEGSYQSSVREILVREGYRSLLAVPLMRDNHLLGGLSVNRKSTGAFDSDVIALLQTFATQSALAIQNARLFREIETKSRQLETASQHKSEFLANMSHELRTPLNAIIGFSEVLAERLFGDINDKQAEYLADIMDSGRHLLALINDILDLSKIEAGRMELDRQDFELRAAIDSTLNLVRERAQRRGIELRCTADERLPKIHADERKVKQVLLNLLSNALKFTPEGGAIDVAARRHDHHVEISVTDTGVGIAPEDQAAVFEEFRQVGTTARKIEGTGLGLAISRRIVELHGGHIGVESEVGRGSTFTFTLPLSPAVPGR